MTELTAVEEILLAAARFAKKRGEFTEWDLTVETWNLNKNRWGLRGYEDSYPDHKRVLRDALNLVGRGWLERTGPSYYRITSTGLARAASLESSEIDNHQRTVDVYNGVKDLAFHRVFKSYLQSADEPRSWIGAAAFLGLSRNDPKILKTQLKKINDAIAYALNWMEKTGSESLRRGDAGKVITREQLLKLRGFLQVLEERFAPQLEAIRSMNKAAN